MHEHFKAGFIKAAAMRVALGGIGLAGAYSAAKELGLLKDKNKSPSKYEPGVTSVPVSFKKPKQGNQVTQVSR